MQRTRAGKIMAGKNIVIAAGSLRNALLATKREVAVVVDRHGNASAHAWKPDTILPVEGPIQAGVTLTKDDALLGYLRPFKPTTNIVLLRSRGLVGKQRGQSGVAARIRPLVLQN